MLIFSRYNLVLLAVPKTGSTALEVALGPEADGRFGNPPELKHLQLYRYNCFVRPLLQLTTVQDPETFALIRQPISWLRSWCRYRARNSIAGLPTSTCHISFGQFVQDTMSDHPRSNIFLKSNQIEPILRRTGQILCCAAKGQSREIIADKLPLFLVFNRKDRASY